MKIAIASEGGAVAGHFGHCEGFQIYNLENGVLTKREHVPNPGHRPGFLPNYLNDLGVNVIISGGMGQGAIDIFNEKQIEVIVGAQGLLDQIASKYYEGQLKSTGSVCHQHQHHGSCGEH